MEIFKHEALNDAQLQVSSLVYTAMPKELFYMRLFVSRYVLENHCVPLSPFLIFDYFMLDTVDRNAVRQANSTLVARADEIWTFGSISDGVLAELIQAKAAKKPIRHFLVDKKANFKEISVQELEFDPDAIESRSEYLDK